MGSLQHLIHGLADMFCWAHTHKFFTVFAKCFSCHHLSMTNFTSKSGFLLLNGKSTNTWLSAGASGSCVHWLGLSSSLQPPPRHIHFSPSVCFIICVSSESISVCIMPESRKEHSCTGRQILNHWTTRKAWTHFFMPCLSPRAWGQTQKHKRALTASPHTSRGATLPCCGHVMAPGKRGC